MSDEYAQSDPPLEMCYCCDGPTGFSGRSEDSLYCDRCDEGPHCEGCHESHECPE